MVSSHAECPRCGRLLAPVQGRLPAHRAPQKVHPEATAPLTGPGSPWCVDANEAALR